MLKTLIDIIDDTIHSTGRSYDDLSPREQHTRDAMFAITVIAPLTGAFLATFFAPRTGKSALDSSPGCPDTELGRRRYDSARYIEFVRFYRLVAAWFISIGIFGTLIHYQSGRTTRTTFVLAVLHNQIEVILNCLLLGVSREASVAMAMVYGLIMHPVVLFSNSMAYVFMGAAIMGGANDMLLVCLLLYGKQWILAAGAIAHVASAVTVFTCTIDNFGVLPYNLCIFLTLWAHIGFTLVAILYAKSLHRSFGDSSEAVSLHVEPAETDDASTESSDSHLHKRRSRTPSPRPFVVHTAGNGHAPDPAHGLFGYGRRSPARHHEHQRHESASQPEKRERGLSTDLPHDVRVQLHRARCFVANPMRHVKVSTGALIGMLVLSLVSATGLTLILAYSAPTWGSLEWGTERHGVLWTALNDDTVNPSKWLYSSDHNKSGYFFN